MSDFHMPDAWYEPPEDSCGDVDCDDDPCNCRERAEQAREDDAIDLADAERKERR